MDIKDVKKVVDDLQNKPFLCSKEAIETDSGYVITQKGVKGNEDKGQIEAEIKKKELIGNGSITPDN